MFEKACLRGVELIKGKLTGIVFVENDEKPKVKGDEHNQKTFFSP